MTLAATAAGDIPSITVKYGDLNLATEDGAHRLYGGIAAAARTLCEAQDSRDLKAQEASRTCESAAIACAVNDVHSPSLAAAFATHVNRG